MKRETLQSMKRAVALIRSGPYVTVRVEDVTDALATDAEVKRLRKENKAKDKAMNEALYLARYSASSTTRELRRQNIEAVLVVALKPRKAKREHVCVTHSGDEQVTCDDPKCPRKRHG